MSDRKHPTDREHLDQLLDEALDQTFPASDVVAITANGDAEPSNPSSAAGRPNAVSPTPTPTQGAPL